MVPSKNEREEFCELEVQGERLKCEKAEIPVLSKFLHTGDSVFSFYEESMRLEMNNFGEKRRIFTGRSFSFSFAEKEMLPARPAPPAPELAISEVLQHQFVPQLLEHLAERFEMATSYTERTQQLILTSVSNALSTLEGNTLKNLDLLKGLAGEGTLEAKERTNELEGKTRSAFEAIEKRISDEDKKTVKFSEKLEKTIELLGEVAKDARLRSLKINQQEDKIQALQNKVWNLEASNNTILQQLKEQEELIERLYAVKGQKVGIRRSRNELSAARIKRDTSASGDSDDEKRPPKTPDFNQQTTIGTTQNSDSDSCCRCCPCTSKCDCFRRMHEEEEEARKRLQAMIIELHSKTEAALENTGQRIARTEEAIAEKQARVRTEPAPFQVEKFYQFDQPKQLEKANLPPLSLSNQRPKKKQLWRQNQRFRRWKPPQTPEQNRPPHWRKRREREKRRRMEEESRTTYVPKKPPGTPPTPRTDDEHIH
mgnify:FL=1